MTHGTDALPPPPPYQPPAAAPPAYEPPAATPPAYEPAVVAPPAYEPPVAAPPAYQPATVTPVAVAPPAYQPAGQPAGAAPATDSILEVRDLSISFRTRKGPITAVRGVSFDLHRGEILGLVGESGSGKSTVLGALMQLLPKEAEVTASRLNFDGNDLTTATPAQMRELRGRSIGLIPQRPMTSLSPVSSLRRQLDWLLHGEADERRVRQLLEAVGLRAAADRIDSYPYQFSGGQLQRMLIAVAALADEPAMLLADEPTTTLDVTVQAQVLRLIVEMKQRLGQSVLFVTHDLGVVAQICDRVGVMYGGRLMEIGPVDQIFHNPQHPYTRSLLEALPGRSARGEALRSIPGTAAGSNRLAGCPFAPRCPHASDVCRTTLPVTAHVGDTTVNCHLVAPS